MPEDWKLRLSYTLFESGDAHCVLPVVCCLLFVLNWVNLNLHLFSNIQCQTLNDYFCFFIFSHSTFDVGRSMFDVLFFFSKPYSVPPAKN